MKNAARIVIAGLLAWGILAPTARPAQAAGTVGNGTPGSCDDTAFLNKLAGGGLVTFSCGGGPVTIVLHDAFGVTAPVGTTTIDGAGLISFSAANAAGTRLFQVGDFSALTLTRVSLINSSINAPGGALYNTGRLVLDHVQVHDTGAQTVYGGGAIFSNNLLEIKDSVFTQNSSAGGGAIFNDVGGTAVIQGSTFLSNTVANGYYGGAISNSGRMTVTTSTFAGNSLTLLDFCPLSLDEFCGGGAIANLSGAVLDVYTTDFNGNRSNKAAGAILNKGGLRLLDSSLTGNFVNNVGGAIANVITATAYLTRVVISGNQAATGAGLYNYAHSVALLKDVTIRNNQAGSAGGAIYNNNATASLARVTLSDNLAGFTSGAIENRDGAQLFMTNSTMSGNWAGDTGGAIWNFLGAATLTHVTISNNKTREDTSAAIDNYSAAGTELNLKNVLLVDNAPANCVGKPPTSAFFSLSTDDTCVTDNVNNNRGNTSQLLGPLTDNGGYTFTRLPDPGSEAVDHGSCIGGLMEDQRGLTRQVNGACDIGAVERQANDLGFYIWTALIRR
ncbi:MAG: choice-of-anchor Q domain-containing protein [Anaerolineales bacterium]